MVTSIGLCGSLKFPIKNRIPKMKKHTMHDWLWLRGKPNRNKTKQNKTRQNLKMNLKEKDLFDKQSEILERGVSSSLCGRSLKNFLPSSLNALNAPRQSCSTTLHL